MEDSISLSDKWQMIKFILSSNKFTNGEKVLEFEKAWSQWLGCRYSLYVNSGSSANLLLMSAIKEKYKLTHKDKVLLPACTWSTNVSPVLQCGLLPVFCDVNLDNYSFDITHLAEIARNHSDIKVIFVTHLLGFSANIELYKFLFPKAVILEDICESHGCLGPTGDKRGTAGEGSTFSFYYGHHMTTVEGGMVCTNDPELYALMKIKRSHGLARELPIEDYGTAIAKYPEIDPRFLFMTDGYNFRNSELYAVLGLNQLKRLDKNIALRRKNFATFMDIIEDYSETFYIPVANMETNSSYAFPLVTYDHEDAFRLKKLLEEAGIETRPIVGGNLLKHPFLNSYIMSGGADKKRNVDVLNNNGVYIGNNQFIGDKEFKLIKEVLRRL